MRIGPRIWKQFTRISYSGGAPRNKQLVLRSHRFSKNLRIRHQEFIEIEKFNLDNYSSILYRPWKTRQNFQKKETNNLRWDQGLSKTNSLIWRKVFKIIGGFQITRRAQIRLWWTSRLHRLTFYKTRVYFRIVLLKTYLKVISRQPTIKIPLEGRLPVISQTN